MKYLWRLQVILFQILALFLISCEGPSGPDGKDGSAFLKTTSSDGYLYVYSDNNPSMPSPLITGQKLSSKHRYIHFFI